MFVGGSIKSCDLDVDVSIPLPSNFNEKGLTADEARFFGNMCDETGDSSVLDVKMGLNGLPNLDGIGRMRPPKEGILIVSLGVLVADDLLFLITRSRVSDSVDC